MEKRPSALIGHTGFVGSNLAQQHGFDATFNSRNIEDMRGRAYELVVCAGVQAKKWWANQNPEEDWKGIQSLLDVLETIEADRFVLISTVDVYPAPSGVTESTPLTSENHVYGTHRRKVEEFIGQRFPSRHIVRLPGLFGAGLKKNVIFDLLHDNCLDQINPEGVFQYYYLARLWADLVRCIECKLEVLNLAVEPIRTRDIIDRFFRGKQVGPPASFRASYDMRSDHWRLWPDSTPGYLYDQAAVIADLESFLERERSVPDFTKPCA